LCRPHHLSTARPAPALDHGHPPAAGPRTRAGPAARRSSREPLPALQPAVPEDGPPRPRGHAVPEAVPLRALADVRLVGALHWSLPKGSSTVERRRRLG